MPRSACSLRIRRFRCMCCRMFPGAISSRSRRPSLTVPSLRSHPITGPLARPFSGDCFVEATVL